MVTNKDREQLLPKVGEKFEIDGLKYQVVYVKPGQLSVTITLIGVTDVFFETLPPPLKRFVNDVLYDGRKKISENVTLEVHSTFAKPKSKF